jgi:hypothetical protein
MEGNMKKSLMVSTIFLVTALLAWPKFSYADPGDHAGHHGTHQYYRYHDHPHFGVHVAAFYPNEYYSVGVGGRNYYYDDGVYYNNVGGDYVVVSPPAGALVTTIPSDFHPLVINGTTYYTDNGVYYAYTSSGYQVVPAPVVQNTPFTVNVPTHSGGYVSITLKRSGNGYVGPQGEFYSVFPKVSDLQIVYGR